MTRERTTEQRLTDWLVNEAPTELADRVLAETFEQTSATRQVRALPGWRTFRMDRKVISFAAGAAAIAVVVIAGAAFFGQQDTANVGGIPSPTSTPTRLPEGSAAPSATPELMGTEGWVPFMSDRYDFTIRHPADWDEIPADHDWSADDAEDWQSTGHDAFVNPEETIRVSAWIAPTESSMTFETIEDVEAFAQDYCRKSANTACDELPDRSVPMCLEARDCHPALLVPFEVDVQAFIPRVEDGRMIVVAVWRPEGGATVAPYGGARKLLEAFLSTMDVWPDPSSP